MQDDEPDEANLLAVTSEPYCRFAFSARFREKLAEKLAHFPPPQTSRRHGHAANRARPRRLRTSRVGLCLLTGHEGLDAGNDRC